VKSPGYPGLYLVLYKRVSRIPSGSVIKVHMRNNKSSEIINQ